VINWDEMLAGLEQQRTGLEQELADVDAVIDVVKKKRGGVAIVSRPRVKAAKPVKVAAKSKSNGKTDGRSRITEAQLVEMQKLYERGDDATAIGKKFGVTNSAVYLRAKAGRWQRPKSGATASPAAAAPAEPKRETLPGKVRCTSCDLWTETDPCSNCGKKLKRNW